MNDAADLDDLAILRLLQRVLRDGSVERYLELKEHIDALERTFSEAWNSPEALRARLEELEREN